MSATIRQDAAVGRSNSDADDQLQVGADSGGDMRHRVEFNPTVSTPGRDVSAYMEPRIDGGNSLIRRYPLPYLPSHPRYELRLPSGPLNIYGHARFHDTYVHGHVHFNGPRALKPVLWFLGRAYVRMVAHQARGAASRSAPTLDGPARPERPLDL